jgi:hypothetical protein
VDDLAGEFGYRQVDLGDPSMNTAMTRRTSSPGSRMTPVPYFLDEAGFH